MKITLPLSKFGHLGSGKVKKKSKTANHGILLALMAKSMRIATPGAWTVFRKKLKERYQHLTDADLAEIEQPKNAKDWLAFLQQRTGVSSLELARMVEEALPSKQQWPLSPTFWSRNSSWL